MVRETRHLWVGNLPDNIREDRIREHFKRYPQDRTRSKDNSDAYGRVQSVKLLPRGSKEETGEMACTVAFMDIKSASKAHTAEHKLDDRTLTTEYYEPAAIPSSSSPPNTSAGYVTTSPSSTRFPNGHSSTEEHGNFTERFYDRTNSAARGAAPEADYIRRPGYHDASARGRNRDRGFRNGPYNNLIDRHRAVNNSWTYDNTRYNNQANDTGYNTTPTDTNDRRTEQSTKKKTKSRSGSRTPSPSGSTSSRSPSRSRSRSSSSSSSSSGSRETSSTGSPKSRRLQSNNPSHQPVVHSEDRRPLAICVRNLPLRSSDTSLKDGLFHEYKKHGKVTWVKVVGQSSERHAIVCFKKPEDAEKALEVSYDKLFFGCKIEVAPYQGYDVEDNDLRPYEAEIDEFHPKATRTLFIGNLEKDVTASDLRKHFDQFGEIIEIDIKKQGAVSSYAFCQYNDIVSVVKAIRTMDGEHLNNNRIKLGFGKSMPTQCVWVDGVSDSVTDKYLSMQFDPFGIVLNTFVDREKGQALIIFEQVINAQAAVNKMRGVTLRGRKIQVDFASRECQEAFYENLEKQGLIFERPGFDERRDSTSRTFESIGTNRFARYETPTRPRTASYSSRTGAPAGQCNTTAVPSPGTPGSATPRGTGSRSRLSRYEYYDQNNAEYPERHFRSYDEYSQGSPASHEDGYEHEYVYHESPSLVDPVETRLQSTEQVIIPFAQPDIRNLQKERVLLLEQLEECPSSGDELISPKKRLKLEHLDGTITSDVIIEANRDHRKVMEVRRSSDASLKHLSRRPSVDGKHVSYLPHTVCKRRKTAGSDSGRLHHYESSESVGGSRPGTPLCDEKPEHFAPAEPRRIPRERDGPLSLPLPRFASQIMGRGSVSVAGIKGQKDLNILSSPPPAVTSPRISNPKPPSPTPVPPPASPPPRPPSLSSNSSDSDGASPSPSLEERIKSLDEKYEKWSGSRALSTAGIDALAKLDLTRERFKFRHKLLDLDLKEVQPSEIVKSVMAKRSVFDEDSKRLENVGEKYEPKDFNLFPRTPVTVQTTVPATMLSTLPLLKVCTNPLPKTPTMLSPRSSGTALTPAKGLQYPFPTHPPMQPSPSSVASATPPQPPTSTTPRSTHGENRLKPCVNASSDNWTPSKVSVNRSVSSSIVVSNKTSDTNKNIPSNSECVTPTIIQPDVKTKLNKVSNSSRRDSTSSETKSRRNSETSRKPDDSENCDSAEVDRLEKVKLENERIERENAEKERIERERVEKEKQERERLEQERIEKEREEKERLEKERQERERIEKERLERERFEKERLEKERQDRLERELERQEREKERQEQREKERRERQERERKEREDKERREREEKERREREDRERREREDRDRREREEREQRERREREELLEKERRAHKEKEEKEQREEREKRDKEDQLERERLEKERRREEERKHKDDNHEKHRHRDNHSESKHRENNSQITKDDKKDNHISRKEETRNNHDKNRYLDRDAERRKESVKENRDNNLHEKAKNLFNEIREVKDRPVLDHHLSLDLDKNKDPSRRRERNNSLPASIGSKRRISSHDSIDCLDEPKKMKLSQTSEHRKISERRDSKDSKSKHKNSTSSSKNYDDKNRHNHISSDEKRKEKEREREERHKSKNKTDKQKSKNRENRENRVKEPSRESPSTPKSPIKDIIASQQMPQQIMDNKHFLARFDLVEIDKHKQLRKELREKDERKSEGEMKRCEEKKKEHHKSREDTPKSSDERKQIKRERIRKFTNSSDNSDSDEPKKHSIFDIVDDEPAYISMYDKVKARSCKNMQKQEEEKRQEKIKAKFSQLKQSRAKREEKKRSTSWDEDSDSDPEREKGEGRRKKMLIASSDDDDDDMDIRKHLKKEMFSDSDSDNIRRIKSEPAESSDDDHIRILQHKVSKSRITSDTSDDDDFKKVQDKIKTEMFSDNEDQGFADSEEKYKKMKSEFEEKYIKRERKNSKLSELNQQIFGDSNSPEIKDEKSFINRRLYDSSADESVKVEVRKKHKKKQKRQKNSLSSEEGSKDLDQLDDKSKNSEKKKQHSKKDKKRDKTKDDRPKKSKKSKNDSKERRDGKMENIFGSLSDDSEGPKDTETEVQPTFMDRFTDDMYATDSDGGLQIEKTDGLKNIEKERLKAEEKERFLKEEHRKRKEKKRREKEKRLREEQLNNENSMDYVDLGKQLENNIKDDSNEISGEVKIKNEIEDSRPENTVEDVFRFSEVSETSESRKDSERKELKEKKKKRKKSKDEKQRHHHHHHHHDKNKLKSPEVVKKEEEIKIDLDKTPTTVYEMLNKSSPNLDMSISPQRREPLISPIPKTPSSSKDKKRDKFLPGFGSDIDDKIHENAVKSISEFEPVQVEPLPSPTQEEVKVEKIEVVEEKRVVISQEETEDAVAALLGESFGSGQFDDCYIEPQSPTIEQSNVVEDNVQDDEEMRKAVQSLNSSELEIKPDTPQSENDLQIDTDTEEQEEISIRYDNPPRTPDMIDFSQPPKTPDIPSYFRKDVEKSMPSIGSPPLLTPIKQPTTAVMEVKRALVDPLMETKKTVITEPTRSVIAQQHWPQLVENKDVKNDKPPLPAVIEKLPPLAIPASTVVTKTNAVLFPATTTTSNTSLFTSVPANKINPPVFTPTNKVNSSIFTNTSKLTTPTFIPTSNITTPIVKPTFTPISKVNTPSTFTPISKITTPSTFTPISKINTPSTFTPISKINTPIYTPTSKINTTFAVTNKANTTSSFIPTSFTATTKIQTPTTTPFTVTTKAQTPIPSPFAVTTKAQTPIPSPFAVTTKAQTPIPSPFAVTTKAQTPIPSPFAVTTKVPTPTIVVNKVEETVGNIPPLKPVTPPTSAPLSMHNLPAQMPYPVPSQKEVLMSPKISNVPMNRLPITPVMASKPIIPTTMVLPQASTVDVIKEIRPQERPRLVYQQYPNYQQPRMVHRPPGLVIQNRQLTPTNVYMAPKVYNMDKPRVALNEPPKLVNYPFPPEPVAVPTSSIIISTTPAPKPFMPVIQEAPKLVSITPPVSQPSIIQTVAKLPVTLPPITKEPVVSEDKKEEVVVKEPPKTSTPSLVIVSTPRIQTPEPPKHLAIEKVTEELNLSLRKPEDEPKPSETVAVAEPEVKVDEIKEVTLNITEKVELGIQPEMKPEMKPEIKPETEISVIKEIEKFDEDKAETESTVSDVSKERLSADIKEDALDSKEDSDYWSAKEVNIDSVIKKVDALCSADELSDHSSDVGKDEWLDDKLHLKANEKEPEKIDDSKSEEVESMDDAASDDKEVKGARRGGRTRGARKARGGLERGGVQTRRGKIIKETTSPVKTTRGGRVGRPKIDRKTAKLETDDIYEFKDDSDENKDRPRLILTIKSPAVANANGNATVVKEPPLQVTPPKVVDTKEEFASPANTRKSRRLQERDISRSNVDDTIEDVIKNTILAKAGGPRRSARQTATPKAQPEINRKSPRGRKIRRASETTDDSSEEKNKSAESVVETENKDAPPALPVVVGGPKIEVREKPIEGLKATVLRRVKGDMSQEPMSLIDPVTGLLTPMRECEEGRYIPLGGVKGGMKVGTNLIKPIVEAQPSTVVVTPQPQPTVVLKQQKPQSLKAHVLSKAQQQVPPIAVTPTQPVPTFTPKPPTQNLNVNVSLPNFTPTHVSPRPTLPAPTKPNQTGFKVIQPPLSPTVLIHQQKIKTHVGSPTIVNTQIAHNKGSPTIVNTQIAHNKSSPTSINTQIAHNKSPQLNKTSMIKSHPIGSSPPLKQHILAASNARLIGKSPMDPPKVEVSIASGCVMVPRSNASPQGAQRHVLQPGLPVPAYEASLHGRRSPPPAHQNSPSPQGEGIAHFTPGSVPLRPPHDLPPHYLHPSHVMYQQYLRQQQSYHLPRSPIVTGGLEKPGDGQEGEEAPVTSPPLELRRPGSVGLSLSGRSNAVPHSLQSPHDRATDSPQVGQVYNMHSARVQYHPSRYYEPGEPPPAHRPLTSHSSLAALGNDRPPLSHMGPLGTPDRPLSTHSALGSHIGGLGTPERPLSTHLPDRPLSNHLPDRPMSSHIPDRPMTTLIPDRGMTGLALGAVLGAAGNIMGAMARHVGVDAPTSQRGLQAATPPHASQVPPQAESLLMLLKQYPLMWQGLLALKNDQAAVQMYFVSGNDTVAKMSLPKNTDGTTPPLRIFQRMRLEPPQVEGVARKMQMENEHCMLLALPCGHDHMDVLKQSTNLTNGFITYLQQKQAAGIVNVAAPGTTQPPAYVVHIFPSCDFVNENLRRIAPSLLERVADIAHLLIVITTV